MDEIDSYFAPFDHRLCFELALALDPLEVILERYNVSPAQFEKLKKTPAFMQRVVEYRAEIKAKGLSFREKAKIMAEDLLGTAYELIHHPSTPASVKADLLKAVVKFADLEPKDTKQSPEMFLPQIAAAIKGLSDGDLELRVTQIVAKKQQAIDVTPTIQ